MIVFVHLSHAVLQNHLAPQLYGTEARGLIAVFETSEAELWTVAEQAFSSAHSSELRQLLDEWLAANPKQDRVEGVRLADFAQAEGTAASDRSLRAKGLLSSVKTASNAANQAFQLAERGMFLVHRLPFLWRMQARVLAREIVRDSLTRMTKGPDAPVAKLRQRGRQVAQVGLVSIGLLAATGVYVAARARRRG
jgi:hypothetical protein